MRIDDLFKQLTDIKFQADKLLKSAAADHDAVTRFAHYSEEIRHFLIEMQLSDELLLLVNDIHKIDPDFQPKCSFGVRFLGVLTFGISRKKFIARKRKEYFLHHIRNTRDQYIYLNLLMKEM
ncbi:MAG: hypothetical protein RL632_290 [Bacteroidota bacterium]